MHQRRAFTLIEVILVCVMMALLAMVVLVRFSGTEGRRFELAVEEIGDLLFSVTNLTRKLGMDSEALLAAANEKFTRRFNKLENILENEGTNVVEADIDEMERAWGKVKKAT